jgi:hypothetical protein
MKKLCQIILLSFCYQISFSQDATTDVTYKPAAGNATVEVNFNPFSSAPISINYLRFRKFVSDRNAFRMGVSLGFKNQKDIENVTKSSFDINLRPGYEWHFAGTDRLSPYVGLEADFALKSSSFSDDRDALTRGSIKSISGAWDQNGSERGFLRLGANFIIGADYYIVKRLYLGLEVGYGFQSIGSSDIETTPFSGNVVKSKGGSIFQLGSNFNSSLRLGFAF